MIEQSLAFARDYTVSAMPDTVEFGAWSDSPQGDDWAGGASKASPRTFVPFSPARTSLARVFQNRGTLGWDAQAGQPLFDQSWSVVVPIDAAGLLAGVRVIRTGHGDMETINDNHGGSYLPEIVITCRQVTS